MCSALSWTEPGPLSFGFRVSSHLHQVPLPRKHAAWDATSGPLPKAIPGLLDGPGLQLCPEQ
jgi:hypothetical protein